MPVDPYCDHRWDFPCCVWSPLPACRRQYPGRSDGTCPLVPFHQLRPSHEPGRVGSCIVGFGACSAFTHVTACTLAKSPSDSLHQRLQQSRCLHCRSDCYRVERTSSRAGIPPLWTTAFSRRTRYVDKRTSTKPDMFVDEAAQAHPAAALARSEHRPRHEYHDAALAMESRRDSPWCKENQTRPRTLCIHDRAL